VAYKKYQVVLVAAMRKMITALNTMIKTKIALYSVRVGAILATYLTISSYVIIENFHCAGMYTFFRIPPSSCICRQAPVPD
jgi:hypothetical protein